MRDAWYPLLLSAELVVGRVQSTSLFGDPLVLFRSGDGRPACFLDCCPHRGVPLSLGRVVRGRLECAYHGWQYDGSGRCAHMPLLPEGKSIPRSAVARAYPSVERHGFVWVWPGDPSRADAALVPPLFPPGDGHQQTHTITTSFETRYDLVLEHGLDMQHFFHIHTRTLIGFNPPLRAGLPTLDGIEEDDGALSLTWRLQGRGRRAPLVMRAFHPCHLFADLPLDRDGEASLQHVVFFTPIDARRTRGFLCARRNVLTMPIVGHVIDKIYEWVMARGRAEDDPVFHGQLRNLEMGARSHASWPHDVVATRYHRWQGRRSSDEMWFKDLDHARLRYQREGAA